MLSNLIFRNRGQWKLNDILEIIGAILVFLVIVAVGVAAITIL